MENSAHGGMAQRPRSAGEKVRFRPSNLGAEIFAQIEASKEDIAGAKARGGHARVPISKQQPRTLQATIHIPIRTTGDLELWVSKIMEKMSARCLVALTRAQSEYGLADREWKPIFDAEGTWTGKLLVLCSDEAELTRMHKFLQVHAQSLVSLQARWPTRGPRLQDFSKPFIRIPCMINHANHTRGRDGD